IEPTGMETIDAISELLRNCQTVKIEIGGHTDSQGREEMNQQLSQARADAVLNEIMTRRVLTSNLSARGYGEAEPIADNKTEDGREANRRIEFRLVLPEDVAENESGDQPENSSETESETE
ncbi:MAG: OmpA family protein, partial [Boseongicola sp.]